MSSRHIRGNLVFKGNYEHTIAGDVTAAMLANCSVLLCNKDAGAATAVALAAMQYTGQGFLVVDAKGDAATNNITITPNSGTINGAATYTISENYGAVCLIWDGTNFTAFATANPVAAAEMAFLNGVTAGTGAASKALVLDSSGNVTMPSAGMVALTRAAVAAAGSSASDATAMTRQFNAVTGATGATGVALPAAATTTGPVWVINTDTNSPLLVYPVNGGNDNINELAEDAALTLPPRAAACFVPTSATQWYAENFDAGAAPTPKKSILFEDFRGTWAIGDAGPADLWSTTAGSGTGNELATTVANSINGEVTLKTASDDGNNAANSTTFTGINLGYKANQGGLAMEARFKLDAVTAVAVFVGFTDTISTTVELPIFLNAADIDSDATDACGVVFDTDGTTAQFAHGGVANGTDTVPAYSGGAPSAGVYVVVRVEVSSAGAVRGFINGTPIGAAVASAVTASVALTPAVVVSNRGAAQRVLTLDYVKVEQNR